MLVSTVQQCIGCIYTHIYTYLLPWGPPYPHSSPLGHHRAASWAPMRYSRFPLAIYFTHGQCQSQSPCSSHPPFPHGGHMSPHSCVVWAGLMTPKSSPTRMVSKWDNSAAPQPAQSSPSSAAEETQVPPRNQAHFPAEIFHCIGQFLKFSLYLCLCNCPANRFTTFLDSTCMH